MKRSHKGTVECRPLPRRCTESFVFSLLQCTAVVLRVFQFFFFFSNVDVILTMNQCIYNINYLIIANKLDHSVCQVIVFDLTIGYVSGMMPCYALCFCFVDKPWTVGKSTLQPCLSFCHHESCSMYLTGEKNDWHAHYVCREQKQSAAHTHCPSVAHLKVLVLIQIKWGEVQFLIAGYFEHM